MGRTCNRYRAALLVLAVAAPSGAAPSHAAAPATGYCSGAAHADATRVPPELLALVVKALEIDEAEARGGVFVRCVGAKLKACYIGANHNLACGKADKRQDLPEASRFCRANPDARSLPTAAIGNASVYAWSCKGRRAVAGRVETPADAQGFIADYWQEIGR